MENIEKTNWYKIVKADVDKISQENNLEKVNFRYTNKKYRTWIKLLTSLISLFIFAILVTWMIVDRDWGISKTTKIVVGVLGPSAVLTGTITLYFLIRYYQANKIEQRIIRMLNIPKYYSEALVEITDKKFELISLEKKFTVYPQNFLPKKGNTRIDNVLNIGNSNKQYSFGTITNEIITYQNVVKEQKQIKRTYIRFPYLSVRLEKDSNLVATISNSQSFLKIFKSKDNIELESTEFEKMFAVVANDQVEIRKILVPKTMSKLIDLGAEKKDIPRMEFNHQFFTSSFASFSIDGWADLTKMIAGIDFIKAGHEILHDICLKIDSDIKWFLDALKWIEVFDIK